MYKKNVLVTGGAGFIGSNFVEYFVNKYPEYKIVTLDKLTYAGDLNNLKEVQNATNHVFIQGDICDVTLLEQIFTDHNINGIIHLAAESHVDNSISGPYPFIKTNIEGTFWLLETARKFWLNAPGEIKTGCEDARFHHVSTDEVYGSLGETGLFTETSPYQPNSPYSASKASSDHMVRAYHHTYGLNVTISNCSNNYGPKQHKEKLIPTIINKALKLQPIPIYGDGKNIRDWLYVEDHCTGIDLIYHKGILGETYNIGGNNEKTNLEIARTICGILDEICPRQDGDCYDKLITFVNDRVGHDFRYAIDASKIVQLGWCGVKVSFVREMQNTVKWYMSNKILN